MVVIVIQEWVIVWKICSNMQQRHTEHSKTGTISPHKHRKATISAASLNLKRLYKNCSHRQDHWARKLQAVRFIHSQHASISKPHTRYPHHHKHSLPVPLNDYSTWLISGQIAKRWRTWFDVQSKRLDPPWNSIMSSNALFLLSLFPSLPLPPSISSFLSILSSFGLIIPRGRQHRLLRKSDTRQHGGGFLCSTSCDYRRFFVLHLYRFQRSRGSTI